MAMLTLKATSVTYTSVTVFSCKYAMSVLHYYVIYSLFVSEEFYGNLGEIFRIYKVI